MNFAAELISIGDELLCGQTLNTHGRDLGSALATIGLQLMRDTTIPDHIELISSATTEALARTDLVFVSGGLGPTVDDLTRDALAQLFQQEIILHPPTVAAMTARYAAKGYPMTPVAERQALVLEHANVLPNSAGAAPGERLDLPDQKTLFILPGPPNEFNAILNEEVLPWLRERYASARPKCVRMVHTKGIGEAAIVARLEDIGFKLSEHIAIGFYPGQGRVKIKLSAEPEMEYDVTATEHMLLQLLADFIES